MRRDVMVYDEASVQDMLCRLSPVQVVSFVIIGGFPYMSSTRSERLDSRIRPPLSCVQYNVVGELQIVHLF